jgi:prepilin-type N-terminal cleavage/methylation domain-containing protein
MLQLKKIKLKTISPVGAGVNAKRRGFTAIELVLVLGIIVILSTVSFVALSGRKNKTELTNIAKQMASLLREAQSRAVSQSNSTAWGVRFKNSTSTAFYALFRGSSYSTSTEQGHYALPTDMAYATATIPVGSSTDIIFSQISGAVSTSTSVKIYLIFQPGSSSTISVSTAGAISY